MPSTLGKNLNLCFTKIKLAPPDHHQSPTTAVLNTDDHTHPILIKNYNSIYDPTFDSSSTSSSSSSSSEPDFATVYASQRFFFSSPGRSNSIIESTPSIATSTESSETLAAPQISDSNATEMINHSYDDDCKSSSVVHSCDNNNHANDRHQPPQLLKSPTVKDSVAVPTYSPDPYMDFRRSMQEMVEARDLVDGKANWDYLHELLSCYLALNPKNTHKFIVGAFADLLVSLLSPSPTDQNGSRREEDIAAIAGGGCEISRQCM